MVCQAFRRAHLHRLEGSHEDSTLLCRPIVDVRMGHQSRIERAGRVSYFPCLSVVYTWVKARLSFW